MHRRTLASVSLVAVTLFAGLLPGLAGSVAAASCSAWISESTPPPAIRVFRHASGTVEAIGFRTYTKNVLSREWIGSWSTESLRSGALAVRNYAWYQVLHWRGGVNAAGACFDLRDDTSDQVYDPSQPTWSTAAAAVDSIWTALVYKNGHIFPTYYNAGAANEACGANANGWKAYQWGTQACGMAGLSASKIMLIYYYPGVTVIGLSGGTPTPSPIPSPKPTGTPTPRPTPSPTQRPTATPSPTPTPTTSAHPSPSPTPHATPSPTSTPRATPASTPSPTFSPTPRPAPTATPTTIPLPAPPADQQLPGGGQVDIANVTAPPPPPPLNPKPVVAAGDARPSAIEWSRADSGGGAGGPLEFADPRAGGAGSEAPTVPGPLAVSGQIAAASDLAQLLETLGATPPDARLVTFRQLFPRLVETFVGAIARQIVGTDPLAAFTGP